MTRTIYRDRKTGRFVSKSKWTRSKSAGGTRYKRERQTVRRKPKRQPPVPPSIKIYEWIVTFTYEPKQRSFDVIVTGHNEDEAENAALDYVANTDEGRRFIKDRVMLKGWSMRTARGHESAPREPEYRSESEK